MKQQSKLVLQKMLEGRDIFVIVDLSSVVVRGG